MQGKATITEMDNMPLEQIFELHDVLGYMQDAEAAAEEEMVAGMSIDQRRNYKRKYRRVP